jgi:hypothetical protein
MTPPESHRCAKCNKWIATYHLPTPDGWTRRCAMCLTPDERTRIDKQAVLATATEDGQ